MELDASRPLTRPVAVDLAVLVLALLQVGVAYAIVAYGGSRTGFAIFAAVFWSAVWYSTLWRVWRGGPVATAFASLTAIGIPGIMLLFSPIAIMVTGDVLRSVLIAVPSALGVAAGFALRRPEVAEWTSRSKAA